MRRCPPLWHLHSDFGEFNSGVCHDIRIARKTLCFSADQLQAKVNTMPIMTMSTASDRSQEVAMHTIYIRLHTICIRLLKKKVCVVVTRTHVSSVGWIHWCTATINNIWDREKKNIQSIFSSKIGRNSSSCLVMELDDNCTWTWDRDKSPQILPLTVTQLDFQLYAIIAENISPQMLPRLAWIIAMIFT